MKFGTPIAMIDPEMYLPLVQAAEAADAGCPFSALIRASATVAVSATLS